MRDPLRKLAPGERIKPGEGWMDSTWYNLTIDAIKFYLRQAGRAQGDEFDVDLDVDHCIANVSWTAVDQYGIAGLGAAANAPSATISETIWREESNYYS